MHPNSNNYCNYPHSRELDLGCSCVPDCDLSREMSDVLVGWQQEWQSAKDGERAERIMRRVGGRWRNQEASDAVMEYVEKNGEPMYCGFANIKIKPARGRLVKYLKENNMGSTSSYGGGGYRVSYYEPMDDNNPYYRTQSMDIREVACDAACKVLAGYGILCYMESRAD